MEEQVPVAAPAAILEAVQGGEDGVQAPNAPAAEGQVAVVFIYVWLSLTFVALSQVYDFGTQVVWLPGSQSFDLLPRWPFYIITLLCLALLVSCFYRCFMSQLVVTIVWFRWIER